MTYTLFYVRWNTQFWPKPTDWCSTECFLNDFEIQLTGVPPHVFHQRYRIFLREKINATDSVVFGEACLFPNKLRKETCIFLLKGKVWKPLTWLSGSSPEKHLVFHFCGVFFPLKMYIYFPGKVYFPRIYLFSESGKNNRAKNNHPFTRFFH